MTGQKAGDRTCVVRGGGFLCKVSGSLRTLGNPGRLLEMPVLAAAQGVCGNDTARAAEIPPLLTLAGKWSSSSGTINGDRSLRGAGGQRAGGGGAARPAGVGAPATEVKKHRPAKGHSGVVWIQNRTGRHHIGYHITKGGSLITLVSDTSHNTTGLMSRLHGHTMKSVTCNYTMI